MSELALAFVVVAALGGVILYRMPDHLSVDRDMATGCLGVAMVAVGVLGALAVGGLALLRGLA